MNRYPCFIILSALLLLGFTNAHSASFNEPSNSTLRICSYNIMQNKIKPGKEREHSFVRMLNGVKADIWMLQEMFYVDDRPAESELSDFRDHVESATGYNDYNYAWGKPGLYILTRYPILWDASLHHRVHATWIDLPSNVSDRDLVVINVHLKGSSTNNQAQSAIDLMNEVRSGNHSAGIPSNASFIVCGDFNQTSTQSAFTMLAGAGFSDCNPFHIETSNQVKTIGNVKTNGSGNWTEIGNNEIDFVMHNSGNMSVVNRYIMNTIIMKQSDLDSSGIKRGDVSQTPESTNNFNNANIACDHFPIVVDYDAGGNGQPIDDDPVVNFVNPPAFIMAGERLELTVDATDSNGIQRVHLYMDGSLVRTEGQHPYEWGFSNQTDTVLENMTAGTYEFRAVAEDTLTNEGEDTISVTVLNPGDFPPVYINFQSSSAAVPSGYLADTSLVYGDRGNGYSYGWGASFDMTRERNNNADQRLDTFNHTQAGGQDQFWEIELPNGQYVVSLTGGDPSYDDSFINFVAEEGTANEVTLMSASASGVNFVSGTETVTVSDGRLTISNGANGVNNKICYIDIVSAASADPYEDWKTTNSITDDNADDDNDGISNIMEFALGGDPNSASSGQKPTVTEAVSDFEFKFQRNEDSVTYTIEKSTDLITWTDYMTVTDTHGAVGAEATVSVPKTEMGSGKLFLRLKVEN